MNNKPTNRTKHEKRPGASIHKATEKKNATRTAGLEWSIVNLPCGVCGSLKLDNSKTFYSAFRTGLAYMYYLRPETNEKGR